LFSSPGLDSLLSSKVLSLRRSAIHADYLFHLVPKVYLCSAMYSSCHRYCLGRDIASFAKNMVSAVVPLCFSERKASDTIDLVGDIVYLNAMGQGILVLGSQRRAVDLLDKRAANYSDRPVIPIVDM
jgi:hypothetical protein